MERLQLPGHHDHDDNYKEMSGLVLSNERAKNLLRANNPYFCLSLQNLILYTFIFYF